jgi:hypothetical protein
MISLFMQVDRKQGRTFYQEKYRRADFRAASGPHI